MITDPLSSFLPYQDRVRVCLSSKEDGHCTDLIMGGVLGTDHTAALRQMHGSITHVARSPLARTEAGDGLVTDQAGLALIIRAADCQTFVLYAPDAHVAAVLHVGWKGLIAGAIHSCMDTLRATWNIDPARLVVGAGPSLCMSCAEFTDPIRELPGIDPKFIDGRHTDLRGIADAQWAACGVPTVDRMMDCTKCQADRYWTYRGGDKEAVMNGATNMLGCVLA